MIDGDVRVVPDARDVQALQNLLFAYAKYTDAGCRTELAALFTDDATWNGDELGFGSATGPDAIAALVTAHHDPAEPMMHLPGPAALTVVDADTVQAELWCLATRWVDGCADPVHPLQVHRPGPPHRRSLAVRRHERCTASPPEPPMGAIPGA